jgi:hypothetical protein
VLDIHIIPSGLQTRSQISRSLEKKESEQQRDLDGRGGNLSAAKGPKAPPLMADRDSKWANSPKFSEAFYKVRSGNPESPKRKMKKKGVELRLPNGIKGKSGDGLSEPEEPWRPQSGYRLCKTTIASYAHRVVALHYYRTLVSLILQKIRIQDCA